MNGVVEEATENELADACARADRTGLTRARTPASPSHARTSSAIAGDRRARSRGRRLDATALKFTEFKLGYHESTLPDVASRLANVPVSLPPDVDVVAKHIHNRAIRRPQAARALRVCELGTALRVPGRRCEFRVRGCTECHKSV